MSRSAGGGYGREVGAGEHRYLKQTLYRRFLFSDKDEPKNKRSDSEKRKTILYVPLHSVVVVFVGTVRGLVDVYKPVKPLFWQKLNFKVDIDAANRHGRSTKVRGADISAKKAVYRRRTSSDSAMFAVMAIEGV